MQLISGSVGEGGVNNRSDVALVQAILGKIQRSVFRIPMAAPAPGGPYLASYDGICGPGTKAAIRAFQDDFVLRKEDGGPNLSGFNTGLGSGVTSLLQSLDPLRATPGLVAPLDSTWTKLLEKVPAEFSDLRILPGGKTVYVADTVNRLHQRVAAAAALTFQSTFFQKLSTCINLIFSTYGIAVGVCPKGDRRTFATQDDLLNNGGGVTNAGPGESNHNYGMAVDLGFEGLRWMRSTGAVVTNEGYWLALLAGVNSEEAMKFWKALRSVGTSGSVGLFRGPEADRPHLQNWDDANVSMGARLSDLLTRSGSMKWEAH